MKGKLFKTVQMSRPKSNVFDLTHDVKMTGNMGSLMPSCVIDVFPGDNITLNNETFIRFQPLVSPVLARMDVTVHYFFVPNRILWEGWEKFIVDDPAAGALPFITLDGTLTADEERLLDHFGIPPFSQALGVPVAQDVNALPFAAYQKIRNEYYRDENLQVATTDILSNGDNTASRANLLQMHNRSWSHDYFTANLPFAQKGTAVDIPLGRPTLDPLWSPGMVPQFVDGTLVALPGDLIVDAVATNPITTAPGGSPLAYDPDGSLVNEPTTINELRTAFRVQEWLERNARGGTRYIENILAHFGVRSSDKRLQRPEYITGTKSPVVISEIPNTTGESGGIPQGTLAGKATAFGEGHNGSYFCEEHGYIIGILSVMPQASYSQGIPRHFLRRDPLEFPWPEFANLGEQLTLEAELTAYQGPATPANGFGYLPRYTELKYMQSRICGEFRTSLIFWTLNRYFTATPVQLNSDFIECDNIRDDLVRIFAVQDPDYLLIVCLNKVKARRLLPVYGTPML